MCICQISRKPLSNRKLQYINIVLTKEEYALEIKMAFSFYF
jgi:hypothetical protein